MAAKLKSYSSTEIGLKGRIVEFLNLYRRQSRNIPQQVSTLIDRMRGAENEVQAISGMSFDGLRVLEIGPGQKLRQTKYFARKNRVTAIDIDELVQGNSLASWWKMLRANGPIRVAKTAARKALGIDAAYEAEMERQLGSPTPKHLDVRRMDAASMTFEPGEFDLVYSYSVFEHLPECERVLADVARVLRPGGVAYISLHLYTSDSGCHDPRIFSGQREGLPLWAHLRPAYADRIHPNSFLNRLRLAQWVGLFEKHMPGTIFRKMQYGEKRLRPEVEKLHAASELAEYTDDELLTTDFVAIWRKPDNGDGRARLVA